MGFWGGGALLFPFNMSQNVFLVGARLRSRPWEELSANGGVVTECTNRGVEEGEGKQEIQGMILSSHYCEPLDSAVSAGES